MDSAIKGRLYEELGISCALQFLFKFQYQAQFDATGAENELCSVFIGRSADPVTINRDEIMAWRWVSPAALQREITARGARDFTPWFVLEWARIWREHRAALHAL
jgi:isopentenyl-diphosphate delta-isomerase